jgi:hypothetical protein
MPSIYVPQQTNTLSTINTITFNKKSTPNYIWQETCVKKCHFIVNNCNVVQFEFFLNLY